MTDKTTSGNHRAVANEMIDLFQAKINDPKAEVMVLVDTQTGVNESSFMAGRNQDDARNRKIGILVNAICGNVGYKFGKAEGVKMCEKINAALSELGIECFWVDPNPGEKTPNEVH